MSKIKCIIVEDEPLAAKVLSDYIGEVPFLELMGTFKDAILATEFLRDQTIDLIFLDIHLPKLKGMAFLRTLTHPPAVIVTTAYHQYAVEGFELNVTDYLLKPIEFERFLVAVNKVRDVSKAAAGRADFVDDAGKLPTKGNQPLTSSETSSKAEYLFLNVQKKKVKILFAELLYIESQREYVKIVTTNKEYLAKMSTHEIESLLPRNLFKRIHRSFIVSLDKIQAFTAEEVEVNGVAIPVGREYRHFLDDL
ncbi:MAG TPA: LytTR family DNA-binding domain-containing protein [Chryseolinea sp.]|nr:LytTR family DNA-binding domain-containing protein [Chryseolinea sp.]